MWHEKNVYVNQNTEVNEHRAPTDKSIEIYKDLQEKARASILSEIRVESSLLKDVYMNIERVDHHRIFYINIKFNLGGIPFEKTIKARRHQVDEIQRGEWPKDELEKFLIESMAKIFSAHSQSYKFMTNDYGTGEWK